ncbi:putative transcriptional regulator [Aneurinibacillus soli]|uniref:Uncharacterized protein n=1 Tax=Aneurinibacillus soli TaxID=1500254 RepID=A0A0U4WHY5_9BACL|nr:helix-turn-helix transcriptional regulator [Aneurinibacillus soli]PYE64268.1 putative transcriptional regulator [Aneurinibacillus soli]BAU28217.1 hypothetical protein CB4_02391 [Aneurinibacillus soli]
MNKVKNNLSVLMGKRKIRSINQLSKETGLRHEALNRLYAEDQEYNPSVKTLIILCDFFECDLHELIEYTPAQ